MIKHQNKVRLLVNIRGCNGAGKSTIPILMMDDPQMYTVTKKYKGKQRKILTVFPTYGWVTLGTYFNKTGGLDVLPNNELILKSVKYAIKHFPDYDILMEGIIASTIYSTYLKLFYEVQSEYGIKVIVMNFLPPFETCLERVYQRNGGKPIKEGYVLSKYRTVERNHERFKADDICSLKIDNSRTFRDNMLKKFLKTCEKYRR